jgi:cytoskeleton protein RodZ
VGKFGERLRKEREKKNVTLDQIAESTKISSRNLRALEEENFAILPGGIFNKGFVRSYARYLGIDEDKAVADYLSAAGEKLPQSKIEGGQIPDPPPAPRKLEVRSKGEGSSAAFWLTASFLLLIALALGGEKYYMQYRAERAVRDARAAKGQSAPVTAAPAPVSAQLPSTSSTDALPIPAGVLPSATDSSNPVAASSSQQPVPETASVPLLLQVHVNQDAWVQLTADGALVVDRLLPAGTERTFRGIREIKLITGNAGGIDISLNGKKVDTLGPEGARREKTFTAQ